MYSLTDYGIQEDETTKRARGRVLSYIQLGEKEQQRLLEYCAKNIPRDRYVHPKMVRYCVAYCDPSTPAGQDAARVLADYELRHGARECMSVHPFALGQLSDICGLDRKYMRKLDEVSAKAWRRELLCTNLNELFDKQTFLNRRKQEAKFLHRLVGNELRGVLTQSYNRHLVSHAVLQPFLQVCGECGLKPVKATITDTRVSLQTYLPFAFQPIPGEFVAIGACWSNSDFGEGRLRVSCNLLRLRGGGSLVTEDAFSRTHIGSVVTDTDLVLSDDVAVKELETVAAAIQSTVRAVLAPKQVEKILEAIELAHAERIPWQKVRDVLGKFLTKAEIASVAEMLERGVEELPAPGIGADGNPLPTRWWAASALAHLAEKQTDPGKAFDLKQAAGTFLEEK